MTTRSDGLSRARKISLWRLPEEDEAQAQESHAKHKYLRLLARSLLTLGPPSHRIGTQLEAAALALDTSVEFVYLPNLIVLSVRKPGVRSTGTYFVRASGKVSLSHLHHVDQIYQEVLHKRLKVFEGIQALQQILKMPPLYSLWFRCFLSFLSSSIICGLAFGGSLVDMWISGCCASVLQYLGLHAAHSAVYANVFEVTVAFLISFLARALSSIHGNVFCYSAITSAGVVHILPKFMILTSSLELMSRNVFCGSVRIVYAIIYTLFLGFGITLGSELYLSLDSRAKFSLHHHWRSYDTESYVHGKFTWSNETLAGMSISGTLNRHENILDEAYAALAILMGGFGNNHSIGGLQHFWSQYYSFISSLSNLQHWKSPQIVVMVVFSSVSWTVNRICGLVLSGKSDIVSAAGALTIGVLGNMYSRLVGGTAFTVMVTGVMFLVPSGIAQLGGVTSSSTTSRDQYANGFALAMRMLIVACGVTIGLLGSQCLVYAFGSSFQSQAAKMAY
ncbi:hypothetical protein DL96DRAFT_1677403 [Flagelloscypha sp. PMI_526]|nr:hypothetical protein DL96DRAFT_1677403 [Flagelloscypha sp. PMI_526]